MKYNIGDILVGKNKPLFETDRVYVVVFGITQSKDTKQYRLFPLGNQHMPFPLNPDGTYTYVNSIEYVEKWYSKVEG